MLVSCKVSYSTLVYVEQQGAQLAGFFEKQDTPVEFLKDPSSWLPIEKLENFLRHLCEHLGYEDGEAFLRDVGRSNHQLRAWGVLDSVLKMVESPRDIFSQPDRFLSYFLSPHPEVKILKQDNKIISFQLAKPNIDFPLIDSYLIGAVEGLPYYMSKPMAKIDHQDGVYHLHWEEEQESLFTGEEKSRRQFHPDMVQSVIESLHEHQQSLEKTKRSSSKRSKSTISEEDFEEKVREQVHLQMAHWLEQRQLFEETLFKVKNDFYKLYDYFTRAQQLVTLISGTARKASVREAMRRVDWPYVQKEFPDMIESACDSILSLKDAIDHIEARDLQSPAPVDEKTPVDLNELIDTVIEGLPIGPRHLKIDKHWLLDKKIAVDPKSFSEVIENILNSSIERSRNGSEVRVVTRPNGPKVEIEITDTGQGFGEDDLKNIFSDSQLSETSLRESQEIIRNHDGNISISSRYGEGATFLIELPLH